MTFKKLIGQLHLWLGLGSGIIVFVLGITGCIYAFQDEIQNLTQPYRFVEAKPLAVLSPSQLKKIAELQMDSLKTRRVTYGEANRSVLVDVVGKKGTVYKISLDPYSGKVLNIKNYREYFFTIILYLHMYLLLPPKIGGVITSTATLIFVFMLVSGLVLWWPKNKNAAKQRFSVKWNTKWKRVNYDVHNVFGFYIVLVGLVIALTGLVWGFEWFAQSVYWLSSGGEKMVKYKMPQSDTTLVNRSFELHLVDKAWKKVVDESPSLKGISVSFPSDHKAPIAVSANPDKGVYYRVDFRYFDQYTLNELSVQHYRGRYQQATFADMVTRLNYDVHVGAIGGLAGKCLAFFASLICASLPITGFYIWWGRRKKCRKP